MELTADAEQSNPSTGRWGAGCRERHTWGRAGPSSGIERLPVGSGPQLSPDQAGKPAGEGRAGDVEAQGWESTGHTSVRLGKNETREALKARVGHQTLTLEMFRHR